MKKAIIVYFSRSPRRMCMCDVSPSLAIRDPNIVRQKSPSLIYQAAPGYIYVIDIRSIIQRISVLVIHNWLDK